MGIMNGLTFGGINSLDYGIYISGDAVFNAPDREVELLQIPGRNGDYVLDHGRFENIEVSYPAGTFGDDQTDFREKLSDFRNAILSQQGYQRLTDTYHPDEYRMGVYASGLEVDPVHYNTAGEFVLTFNCKPQRWLTSGETATSIADGGTVTNPTLFDSSPLLEVEGYGTIDLGGQNVIIEDVAIGSTLLAAQQTATASTHSVSLDMTKMENGDSFVVNCGIVGTFELTSSGSLVNITGPSVTNCTATKTQFGTKSMRITVSATETFAYGTSGSLTGSAICATGVKLPDSSVDSGQTRVTFTIAYDGDSTITYTFGSTETLQTSTFTKTKQLTSADIYGDSTRSALGNPLYIDLDIGEAYNLDYGEPVSINNAVNLGSDLPTLPPGATTVNYDNTITDLKIVPRWWKV